MADQRLENRRATAPEVVDAPRRRRRRWPLVLFFLVAILALGVLVPLFVANRTFNSVERVELGDTLVTAVPEGTNLLLVGTDSRDGIDAGTENSQVILGEGISGERTDTIICLLYTSPSPRDQRGSRMPSSA